MKSGVVSVGLFLFFTPAIGIAQDYDRGVRAYESKDYSTALRELLPLAQQGNADAQYIIGFMYFQGTGLLKDDTEAARWFGLAAKQGGALAQGMLGLVYGLSGDIVSAYMWSNISAASGNELGVKFRDNIAPLMTAAERSEAQRRSRVCMVSGYVDCN